jgi:uncharacterized protein (DUF2384 family)
MATFDEILALKVAVLETLMINVLATSFEHQPRPVEAVRQFADQYRESFRRLSSPNSRDAVLFAEVWNALLDQLVAEVERRVGPHGRG